MNYPIILARNLTKNPQNCHFCALLSSETPIFRPFEHKIEVFVRFLAFGTPDFRLFEHKIAIFVLGKKGIGIGKNKYGLPANHRAHL